MSKSSENELYIIPPNFIESGTIFGGLVKIRNAIEAIILASLVGIPIFELNLSIMVRIIILCLTALPLFIFGIIGVNGECLSSFVFAFFKYLKSRRVIDKTKKNGKKKDSVSSPPQQPIEPINNNQPQMQYQPMQEQQMNNNQ